MNPKDLAPTSDDLQKEIASLRRQNEEYRRLASFPHVNPKPVLEFDCYGRAIYLNPAAEQALAQLGLSDAGCFLPEDFDSIIKAAVDTGVLQYSRVVNIGDNIFGESIYYSPEYDAVRIYATDITQRMKVEQALKISRQELEQMREFIEAVTKGVGVIIATIDKDFCYTYFNQAYKEELKRLSGIDISIGMDMLSAFAHLPDQHKIMEQEWSRVLKGERTNKILNFGDPGIYQRTYRVLHTPIRDAEGNVVGAGEVAYDVTEQVRAQEALRESEARFRMLLKNAPVTVAAQDKDLRFIWAYNQRTINPAEIIGKTDVDIFPPEVAAWTMALKRQVLETGKDLNEQRWITSGGQRLFLDLFLEPIRDKEGQISGVGVATVDLTPIKQADQALRESEERYRSLFEGMTEGFATLETIFDENGNPCYRFLDVNPAFERLTGMKRELVVGKALHEVLPGESDAWINIYSASVLNGESVQFEGYSPTMDRYFEVFSYPYAPGQFAVLFLDITVRKRTEEALRQAREDLELAVQERTEELRLQTKAVEAQRQRFNDVLEILPAYLVLLTPDYHVAFANRFFRERFGEDHGRRCYEYLFNRHAPCEICETYKVLDTKTELHWEWTGPDGHNYAVFDFPFSDIDGTTLILEMGIDITGRKQAEEKLRSANAYNRSLIEANLDALVTITPEGKIGDVNTVTETITGYPRDELIGTDFHSYFKDPDKARAGYEQVFETGMVRDYELEIQHKDGHTTPVVYNASLYQDEAGKVAGVFAAARDISERKQAERQLIVLTTALETAANGIILTDSDGVILWSNSAFSQMTGYSREEIAGKNPRFLKSGNQEAEFYRQLWVTIMDGRVWRGEMINRRKDGSLYHEDQTITPVFDAVGKITNFISIKQDITEKKNYENQLVQAEKHAAIGRMVGSVTHEINNPLQTIKNCLYLLQQDCSPDSLNNEPLEMALSETQRLSNIVGQLRQLYRPQAAQLIRAYDLLELIEEVHALITTHLDNSHVTWEALGGLKHCKIDCIKDQILEVLLNICMNAIEAMQPAGGVLSINMIFPSENDRVGVTMCDTGPGINPEIMSHIFEPFITTKEYGLGLGLSICYGIIQKHGGQISVDNLPGQGSCFTVWLPITG